jgi:hypothetical protein
MLEERLAYHRAMSELLGERERELAQLATLAERKNASSL